MRLVLQLPNLTLFVALALTLQQAPTSGCSDRTGEWTIRTKTKDWCLWARSKGEENIDSRCAYQNLYEDCPVTCDSCHGEGFDRTGEWTIGTKTKDWCLWARSKGEENTDSRCAYKDIYDDCPRTCGSIGGVTITTWMTDMLTQVNQERANAGTGLAPLCYNEKIILAAQAHNQDMVDNNFFDHTGSDNSSLGQRVTLQGYHWNAVRENIAFGQTSVTQVMTSWMNSSGHRANILANNVVHFGAAWDTGTNKWTQVFGASFDSSEGCV